jgi:ABC-2 type transport system ATP-binding protein
MLKVDKLKKSFGSFEAVKGISFEVAKGEVLGFLGPNGAGKTTTMKAIAGCLTPTEGTISIGRYNVADNADKVRQLIGYLPEHNPLYTDMTVIDYLRYMARLQRIRAAKINDRILEMVNVCGLEGEKHKRIGELSKGYRQRVGLAQALIHDPQVLILDEPTTGLDPNQLEEIRTVIKNAGHDKVVLLSTHIMQEVEAMCTRAIIINHGRIVSDDHLTHITSQQLTEKFHRVTAE